MVVLDGEVEDQELLTRWLTEKRGKAVKILIPQRGDQYQLVQMCRKNAAESIARQTGGSGRDASALDELRRLLGLEKAPAYIESYDISNLAGGENVAGMVVFENGRPLKSAYRKFKIKTVEARMTMVPCGKSSAAGSRSTVSARRKGRPRVSAACRTSSCWMAARGMWRLCSPFWRRWALRCPCSAW